MAPYLKVSAIYLAVGVIWIIASDKAVELLSDDASTLTFLQTIKGWFFVGASTVLIFFLTRNAFRKLERAEVEKHAVFRKTLEGSHHILLNYLNQMQLVTIEASDCEDFDKDVLDFARAASAKAADELKGLENIEIHGPSEIEAFVYRGLRETREAIEKSVN